MAGERTVSWQAIANFAQVEREAKKSERALRSLKKTQDEFNASQGGNASAGAAGQNKSQSAALDGLTRATKAYTAAKKDANKANSDSVKTPNENVTGRAGGYIILARGMQEAAKARRSLNKANDAAILTPKEKISGEDYLGLAAGMKAAAAARRSLNKANAGAVTGPKSGAGEAGQYLSLALALKAATEAQRSFNRSQTRSAKIASAPNFDATSFVAGVRAMAAQKKASDALVPSLSGVARESRNIERDAGRAERASSRFASSMRGLKKDASGAGGIIGGIKGALGTLGPEFRRNELGAHRFGAVLRASLVPLVITGIDLLASLLSPLAAGFIGLAGAIAPAAGLLATLPGLFFAAAGGAGTLIAAFAGIGGALKAYSAQQKAAGANSLKAGKASKTAANQQASSARAIKAAEQALADAHDREKEAQKGITEARKQARIEMQNMLKDLKDLALQEEDESLSLEDARQRLSQVMADPGSTDLERRQANLAVRQAQASLDDVHDKQKTAEADAADAAKKGVEGSDLVVQAKKEEAQASRAVADAEDNLAEAKRSGAAAQDSYNDSLAAGSTQAQAYAAAMAKLTPEARAVVLQLIKMKPLIDGIRATAQKGMMPGVLSLLKDIVDLAPLVDTFVGRAARSFGDFFEQVGKALTTSSALKTWGKIFESTNKIIDYFLETAFNLGVTIANIAVAARPLTEWLVRSVRDWTRTWRAMSSGEAGQRRLTRFFKGTREAAGRLGRIIVNLVKTFYNLGKGASGTGNWMLKSFEKMTKGWAKWTGANQKAIKKWADGARPALTQIAGLIGDFIKGIIDLGNKTDITGIIKQIRSDLLPALLKVFGLFTGATASHIVSILTHIANTIAVLGDTNSGGIETFFGWLDKIFGVIDNLVTNVPLVRELFKGLIAVMATKAAISFASSLLGVTSAIKSVKSTLKAFKKGKEGIDLAETSGAKRAADPPSVVKSKAKAAAKDSKQQAKAAEKSGARRAVESTPGTKRGAGKVAKGAVAAAPKRAAGGVEAGVSGLGKVAKVIPALGALGGIASAMEAIGSALGAIGAVGPIAAVVIAGLAVDFGLVYAYTKLFPNQTKKIIEVYKQIWEFFKQFFAGVAVIFQIGFQIIRDVIYVALDVATVLFRLFKKGVIKIVQEIVAGVKAFWHDFVITFVTPVKNGIARAKAYFSEFKGWVGGIIRAVVKAIIDYFNLQPAVDKVSKFFKKIKSNFEGIVAAIKIALKPVEDIVKNAFNKIRNAVGNPIKTVIGVINSGVINPYIKLAKTFGIDTKVTPIDYKVPTFKQGGTIPGTKSNVHRDNLLGVTSKGKAIARVEPGEHIMPRNRSKWFGVLEHIRKHDSLPGHKNGGTLPGYKDGGELFGNINPFKKRKLDSDALVAPTAKQKRNLPDSIPGIVNVTNVVSTAPKDRRKGRGAAADGAASAVARGKGMVGDTGWYRMCLAMVNKAWAYQVGRFRLGTAKQSQNAGPRTTSGKPPGGAGVYWDTGPSGHIALAVGDGTVVSTDAIKAGRIDRVNQTKLNAWGPYKGWWSPNGAKGGTGNFGGGLNLPNPKTFLSGLFDKVAGGLDALKNSEFGKVMASVPRTLFQGLLDNAKNIFDPAKASAPDPGDNSTTTSADKGKGAQAVSRALDLVGSYARGTNSARQGRVLVGENGPEVIVTRGGERIMNSDLTSRLPGYNAGGVVNGMKEGAKGDWVAALRSETHQGTSTTWDAALSKFLKTNLASIGTATFNSYNKTPEFIAAIVAYLKKQTKAVTIAQAATALKIDPTEIWQNRDDITSGLKSAGATTAQQSNFTKQATAFTALRTKWLKALEKQDGESQDGDWDTDSDEPIQHMLDHAFGLPHSDYLEHPWQANTAIEDAIMAQRRANKINKEFDGLVNTFSGWNLTSLVRKMGELGPSDGLVLARELSKNKGAATLYDKDLADDYARSDSASDTTSQASKVNLLVSVLTPPGAPIGLQGAAQALSLSLDSTASVYSLAASQGRLAGLNTSRIDKDVIDFKKLFKFATGGGVPGYGNRDSVHAMLTPGEFVLRNSAAVEIERRFGKGSLDYLNHIDRFATGGLVGGITAPSYRGSAIRVGGSRSDTNNSEKIINYNFNTEINNPTVEEGAVSVQKRVTRVAQLGLLRAQD